MSNDTPSPPNPLEPKPDKQCGKCAHMESMHTFKGTTECNRCQCQAFVPLVPDDEVAETLSYITGLAFTVPEGGFASFPYPQTIFPTPKGPKMIRKNKLFAAVTPVRADHGVYEIDNGIYPFIPKIPWSVLSQTVAFFRYINKTFNEAEVMVQVFLGLTAPEGRQWTVFVPLQKVSKGGITHTGHFDANGSQLHVADIHSHNTMGAFWSGTDDHDERRAERFYGVIGDIASAIPSWKWRVRVGGVFIDIDLETIIDVPSQKTTFSASLSAILGAETKGNKTKIFLTIDPFEEATFPEEWTKQVTVSHSYSNAMVGGAWPTMDFHLLGEDAENGGKNGRKPRRGVNGKFIDLDAPEYLSKPKHEWDENDHAEYEADLEIAALNARYGDGARTRTFSEDEPRVRVVDTSRGWYPPGDPFPSVYDGTKRITFVVGDDNRVTRRTESGLNIITTLSLWQIYSNIIPKVGKDLIEVYNKDGSPYVWRSL